MQDPLNFQQFYEKIVKPHRELHADYIRLDGILGEGSLKIFGCFYYKGDKWNVHSDTEIDKLKKAYEAFHNDPEPFAVVATPKGLCLELKDHKAPKKLYIYRA
jgi:hypothetical protein